MTSRPSYHLLEIRLSTEKYEAGLSFLYDEGCIGAEEREADGAVFLKSYFPSSLSLADLTETVKKKLGEKALLDQKSFVLDSSVFKAGKYDPFEFVKGVWVVPPPELMLESHPVTEKKIMIRPGMGFGTGRDDTTRLAAQNFCSFYKKIRGVGSVLDVGTGSGILAILARKLGAKKVSAVEIDPDALENAEQNLALNGVTDIHLYKNITEVHGAYDVVIANIVTPTILELANTLRARLKPGGHLILSGILKEEVPQILSAFDDFKIIGSLASKEWISVLLYSNPN